ncbi:hypothetical protein KUV64_22090 [Mameliella alba]|uniref:DUF7146 domain-containing protein n=1 Tax=Mameliella alba TaxID=561184 RepID=UPI001C95E174|nr:CHC2 zinc finger domain-containing protein [Mameliella alba]MBY6121829.1 hypothetical protein [Mameliella alba]
MSPADPRRDEARLIPILEVAERLGVMNLRASGAERVGPCPQCGGTDRFSINRQLSVFHCRICGSGGDQIDLVQHVLGCSYRDALGFLVGEAVEIDPAARARARARAEAAERKRAEAAERMRGYAISEARAIWRRAQPAALTWAEAYLEARGITFPEGWPPSIRFLPDHPAVKKIGGELVELHRGPCMISAVQSPERLITAVHQTWIDPARPGKKAEIALPDGTPAPAKMVRGSKKGGAIRLTPWRESGFLVMGEGIETTASILSGGYLTAATFWAGVDLGNMGGRQVGRNSGVPLMSDEKAFVPPPGTRALIFLQDGDSDPKATRAKLEAGLERARRMIPGLRAGIASAVPGQDFNDMLRALKGAPNEGAPND